MQGEGRSVTREVLIGCSTKSYLGVAGARAWADTVARAVGAGTVPGPALYVCPPFPLLPLFLESLASLHVGVGAQDVSASPPGASTGEVSAALLAELGVTYVMVGHPERHRVNPAEAALVPAKVGLASRAGLTPIIIVGEPDRDGDPRPLWRRQLREGLAELTPGADLVIAYEPTWAIGQPRPAPPAHIVEAVTTILDLARDHAAGARILYGGSADLGTFSEIAEEAARRALRPPDGIFLGRAGLDAQRFLDTAREVLTTLGRLPGSVDAVPTGPTAHPEPTDAGQDIEVRPHPT